MSCSSCIEKYSMKFVSMRFRVPYVETTELSWLQLLMSRFHSKAIASSSSSMADGSSSWKTTISLFVFSFWFISLISFIFGQAIGVLGQIRLWFGLLFLDPTLIFSKRSMPLLVSLRWKEVHSSSDVSRWNSRRALQKLDATTMI